MFLGGLFEDMVCALASLDKVIQNGAFNKSHNGFIESGVDIPPSVEKIGRNCPDFKSILAEPAQRAHFFSEVLPSLAEIQASKGCVTDAEMLAAVKYSYSITVLSSYSVSLHHHYYNLSN